MVLEMCKAAISSNAWGALFSVLVSACPDELPVNWLLSAELDHALDVTVRIYM